MTLRPLTGWPMDFTPNRKRSQFKSSFTDTLSVLSRELRHLGGGSSCPPSVLQIALRQQDFRNDGLPRASSIPDHPGVILNVEPRRQPPLSFPCDTFDRWQDNLRAIALGLEALRKVDRYGITQTGQQYRGWQAIEAKSAGFDSADAAMKFVAVVAGVEDVTPEQVAGVYRGARARAHPDRNNGDQTQWDRVEAAGKLLRAAGLLSA